MEVASAAPILLSLDPEALQSWVLASGQPAYRAAQIREWIYAKGVRDLEAVTVLPKGWRKAQTATVGRSRLVEKRVAADGTTKLLLALADGERIETVGIPTARRLTVCVSSQVGCPMGCRFCATGKDGLQRSLQHHEMVDQVLSMRDVLQRTPTHVVFMGMGEPLLNTDAVLRSIMSFCRDLGMGQRRMTVSTVGIPGQLQHLNRRANQLLGRCQFTLAVSLHAPNQQLRETLVPTARTYPLARLLQDCQDYVARTGRRVSFEYILLAGINDRACHAEELADRIRGFPSHVNLMAYNPIAEETFQRPTVQSINRFRHVLEQRGVAVSVRASRGLDHDAACGQLRRRSGAAA